MKNITKNCVLFLFVLLMTHQIFAQSGSFTISFEREDFKIEHFDDYSYLKCEKTGMYYKDNPGRPALPCFPVNFAVPYGSKFIDVSMSFDTVLIASNIVIQPMQQMVPVGMKNKRQKKIENFF